MLDYVRHLECEDTFEREKRIDEQVEQCVQHWRTMRERPGILTPMIFHISNPSVVTFYGEGATVPMSDYSYHTQTVKIYSWMNEQHVRYLTRMQLVEQADTEQ